MNPTSPHQPPEQAAGKILSGQSNAPGGIVERSPIDTSSKRPVENQRRLRNYLINSSVQLKLALTNLAYMLLVLFVVLISVLVPQYLEIWQTGDPHYQHTAARLFLLLLDRMVIALAAVLIIAFAHQVLITHKICGPLVNFSKSFKAIRDRDLTRRVRLRRNDFLKHTAKEINQMTSALADHMARIKADHHSLDKDLAAAVANLHDPGELTRILASARGHAESCSAALEAFSLPDQGSGNPPADSAKTLSSENRTSTSHSPKANMPEGA